MKYYGEFHQHDLAGELGPACGDQSVIILDGRMSSRNQHAVTAAECKKRGYFAYAILRGDSLLRSTRIGPVISVHTLTDLRVINEQISGREE